MRQLFEIDLHDYREGGKVSRRPSARGIIIENGKIALVYSRKEQYYKFPGGGIHGREDKKAALVREVREETGLVVIPESITEFGSVMRRQRSNLSEDTVFEQENFYYLCRTESRVTQQHLDDYEREAEFTLQYVPIDQAIAVNDQYRTDEFFDEIMIRRENKVLRLIRDQMLMQELLPYAFLIEAGIDEDNVYQACGNRLEQLLEQYPDNRHLRDIEFISGGRQTAAAVLERTGFPIIQPECFCRGLLSLLQPVYQRMELSDFAGRMYELWQKLPESVSHTEPLLTLSYADDPLACGDEARTRELYGKMLAYNG